MSEQRAFDVFVASLRQRQRRLEPPRSERVAAHERRRGAKAGSGEKGASIHAAGTVR
jgi:hypothetical protein